MTAILSIENMTKLRIASSLDLPLDAVTQTIAILAKRGMGKTYTALVLVEEFLKANLQTVVADPVGVCWGLRSSADGKSAGYPIIVFGGDHGDVPLEVTAGETVADFIIESGQSAVLDLSLMRKGEQTRFMTDFAERLYHKNRAPLHLVLDEADAFAPQKPMKGQERMLGAIEDLVRRGRARGLGLTLVTQRSAVLNKDVLTQVEVLVALRTIAPQDRAAIDEWIKVHGTPQQRVDMMESLPSLPIGTAWFWSPGWLDIFQRVKVRRRETFDSSATPKVGQSKVEPRTVATVDLEALRARMAATIERSGANNPKALRAEISRLERELSAAKSAIPPPMPAKIEMAITQDQARDLRQYAIELRETAEKLQVTVATIDARLAQIDRTVPPVQHSLSAPPSTRTVQDAPREGKVPREVIKAAVRSVVDGRSNGVQIKAGARRMLQVLASHHQLRVTRPQLATLARMKVTGGTFSTYYSTLRQNSFLQERDGEISITESGMDYLGVDVPPAPQTTEELLAQWRPALKAGAVKMLDILVKTYPDAMSRVGLARYVNMTADGGTFNTYLSTLKRNGLIDISGPSVRASTTLFLK